MRQLYCFVGLCFCLISLAQNKITIDFAPADSLHSKTRYGITLDDANKAIDGGLYAELIRNRNFEERAIVDGCQFENGYLLAPHKPHYISGAYADYKIKWDTAAIPGWALQYSKGARASMRVVSSNPLSTSTPHNLMLDVVRATKTETVQLVSNGFNGVSLTKGNQYAFRLFARTERNKPDTLVLKLLSAKGKPISEQTLIVSNNVRWVECSGTLTAQKTDGNARLLIQFSSSGKRYFDCISLMPVSKESKQKAPLRADLVTAITDLHPAFIRWPGQTSTEGFTMSNRLKWTETLGDPLFRPSQYSVWGYQNYNGLGYHEFLQLCEDVGASAVYVCNAGVSGAAFNGDYCSDSDFDSLIAETLDAINYALADTSTVWGKKRMAAGHAAAFSLAYIQIGYESGSEIYEKNFVRLERAIRRVFPKLEVIKPHPDSKLSAADPVWLLKKSKNTPTSTDSLSIKEYSCSQGVGSGNLGASLSEAAFLCSAESGNELSLVNHASFLASTANRNTKVSQLVFSSNQLVRNSSYLVESLFSNHSVSENLRTKLKLGGEDIPPVSVEGFIGLASNNTHVIYKNVRVTSEKPESYSSRFSQTQEDWDPISGHWRIQDSAYLQSDLGARRLSRLRDRIYTNCTVRFDAFKAKGTNGFAFAFSGSDNDNYMQLNIGANSGKRIFVEQLTNGVPDIISDSALCAIETGKWYAIQLKFKANIVECYIDGAKAFSCTLKPYNNRFVTAGLDEKQSELVIKVVNAEKTPFKTRIEIAKHFRVMAKGRAISLSGNSPEIENSLKKPSKLELRTESYSHFSNNCEMEFKPYSVTVLRIRKN